MSVMLAGGAEPDAEAAPNPAAASVRSNTPHVLIVEDEPGIVDFLERGLQAEGFTSESALDGSEGERLATRGGFDAVVLDLMLPGRSGLQILESVRRVAPSVPVLILTARGELEDRIMGLEAGAVDYLVKPFSMAELVARIRAQLRALERAATTSLQVSDIEVDLLSRRVQRARRTVLLSTTEFELLVFLMRREGQVVSREEILSAVWGYDHDPETNVVDVYVGYLRRKLGTADSPAPISTVRAVGYRLGHVNQTP